MKYISILKLVISLLVSSSTGYEVNNHYQLTSSSGQNDGSLNLRFSTGYDNTFRVFDVDVSNVYECIGLSYLGNIEPSSDTLESYTKIGYHIFVIDFDAINHNGYVYQCGEQCAVNYNEYVYQCGEQCAVNYN